MDEVLERIRTILDLEARDFPDWEQIKIKSLDAIRRIHDDGLVDSIPNQLYQFLDDVDVREKSPEYGLWQRERIRELLRAL